MESAVSQRTSIADAERALDTYHADAMRAGWLAADVFAAVEESESWRDVARSYSAWCDRTKWTRATASKLLAARKLKLSLPPSLQERAEAVAPLRLYLAKDAFERDPEEALAKAESDITNRELIDYAAEVVPEQHRDGARRRISLFVTEPTRDELQRALNVLRVHLGVQGSAYPTDDELATALAQLVMQAPEYQVPKEVRADVQSGKARCHKCKSYARLEQHHVIPRSRSRGGKDAHGVEMTVWLCSDCHGSVTNYGEPGGWRALAEELGVEVPG